jgi:hypothetical protein
MSNATAVMESVITCNGTNGADTERNAVMRKKRSRKQAIEAFCKHCIYDPTWDGTWRQQTEACEKDDCQLYPFRPMSRTTTTDVANGVSKNSTPVGAIEGVANIGRGKTKGIKITTNGDGKYG